MNGGVRTGLWTSAGVGAGIFLHVTYCVLGVALLLSRVDWLFVLVKLIAAAYLAWLGLQALWHAWRSADVVQAGAGAVQLAPAKAFSIGFLTNGLNPKATLFFLALWTVVISPETPVGIQALYGVYLALATFAWFAMLSRLLGPATGARPVIALRQVVRGRHGRRAAVSSRPRSPLPPESNQLSTR